MLFALLAGTGLRIGEAFGLRPTDFGPDCRVLNVRRSIWRGQEQQPKTANALRVVDLPEVLANELRTFVGGVSGYLFATAQGKPLQRRNVLRVLHSVKRCGLSRVSAFSSDVAQKERSSEGLGTVLDGPRCGRGGRSLFKAQRGRCVPAAMGGAHRSGF